MKKGNINLSYVDSQTLDRMADKKALDDYLGKKNETKGEMHFLLNDKLKSMVHALVYDLQPKEQKIILKRYWEDLSIEEISKDLNEPEADIRDQLIKILAELKSKIVSSCSHKDLKNESSNLHPCRAAF